MNYDKKTLKSIKIIYEPNYIFTTVLDNKNIASICENVVKILDNDLNLIASIKHDVKDLSCNLFYKKIDLNYTVKYHQMNYLAIIGFGILYNYY